MCAEGQNTLGRPQVGRTVEQANLPTARRGHGILKVAKIVGVGSETVQRVKKAMAGQSAEAA